VSYEPILKQLLHVLALTVFLFLKCRQGPVLIELNRPDVELNFEAGVRIGGDIKLSILDVRLLTYYLVVCG
jgi:hypothetical protein